MPTPDESRRALTLITSAAVTFAQNYLASLSGSPEERRAGLLESIPQIIGYYTLGSSALAADFYDDWREEAGVRGRFTAEPIIPDREEKIRRAIAWIASPWFDEDADPQPPQSRLAEVVQLEVARANRQTVLENTRRDPQGVGWKRVARADSCKFCQFAARGSVIYRSEVAGRFAAHTNCNCAAIPWFRGQPRGPEASVLQYTSQRRARSAQEKARLRDWLNAEYPDAHG